MALDVVEYLLHKFLSSYEEADSELSGSIFISDLRIIKNVVKNIKLRRGSTSSYSETISVFYDLNDALDECRIFEHESKEFNTRPLRFNPQTNLFVQKMKSRLNTIKRKLEILAFLALHPQEISNRWHPREKLKQMSPFRVYGFDEQVEKIEGLLFEGAAGLKAIGVTGIAGVGKTTLVQKVLGWERVQKEFNPIIWVHFSGMREEEHQQQLSRFSFETCIVDNLGRTLEPRIDDLGKLLQRLNQLLSGKRYLVVLDDVGSRHVDIEERLWRGLPKSRGGAVILTGRTTEVVQKLVEQKNLVLVEPLDREICWLIFLDNIINNMEDLNRSQAQILEKIKEEIKDKCAGLPLAAKTLAEIIRKQLRER